MATTKASVAAQGDAKDKKIPDVPHLEDVTGVEKIPVSAAGGLPRYVEVKQIVEKAVEEIQPISVEYIDSKFAPVYELWLISYNTSLSAGPAANLLYGALKNAGVVISNIELAGRITNLPCFITSVPTMEQAEEAKEAIAEINNTYMQPAFVIEIKKA